MSFTTIANSSCDLVNFDGQITVTATTDSGPGFNPGVIGHDLFFNTIALPAGSAIADPAFNQLTAFSTLSSDVVGAGSYTVLAANNLTTCFTVAVVDVVDNFLPMAITLVDTNDVTLCAPMLPDGSSEVTAVEFNNAPGNTSDFTYDWDNEVTMALPRIGSATVELLPVALDTGTFFVQGTHVIVVNPPVPGVSASGCKTAPFVFHIKDIHVDPTIAAAIVNPDIFCNVAPAAGGGSITINEAFPMNYTFVWRDGLGNVVGTTSGTNGEIAQSLQEGQYSVRVSDNATQCFSDAGFVIENQPRIISVDAGGFTAPALTNCDIATGLALSGMATITDILESGNPVGTAGYTFIWTDTLGSVFQAGVNPVFASANTTPSGLAIGAGFYRVNISNLVSGCFGNKLFEIEDQTIGTAIVTLDDFESPQVCAISDNLVGSPNEKDGMLTVSASGGGASYNFEWFAGDQRPSPAGPTAGLGATIAVPILASTFTVKAINTSNNCWGVDAYTVPLVTNPVFASATATPVTFCTSNNGEVYSTVSNDNKFEYDFEWSIGGAPNTPPDFINDATGLAAGDYTVVAVDKLNSICRSAPITVTVIIDQAPIVPVAVMLRPQTFCDPANPDGVATANVGGDVSNYVFDWFVGPPPPVGLPIYTGAEASNLAAGVYTVRASDLNTGCSAETTVTIGEDLQEVPNPFIEVISDVTSCIDGNGILSATVDGGTSDYSFYWTDGATPATPPDFTNASFIGEIYDSLNAGTYTVVAEHRITKCVSGPATDEIVVDQIIPEMEFDFEPSTCNLEDGYITVRITNSADLAMIEWYKDGVLMGSGPNLENALAGGYEVKVTTVLGCSATAPVILPADILPFNGVSRRVGSLNDKFYIDCIEDFPQNHVEIFNRAGTKVYAADGYDNAINYFDGKSNEGLSLMGKNLPAGTYFYIITKGDGSNKLIGYLEIVD